MVHSRRSEFELLLPGLSTRCWGGGNINIIIIFIIIIIIVVIIIITIIIIIIISRFYLSAIRNDLFLSPTF